MLRYEVTIQIMEALKKHSVIGTIVILSVIGLLALLIYVDKRKDSL